MPNDAASVLTGAHFCYRALSSTSVIGPVSPAAAPPAAGADRFSVDGGMIGYTNYPRADRVLVEVALHGAWGDVGECGDVGVGQAPALEPQDLHVALDAGVGVVIALMANLRHDILAEVERTHGCLLAMDERASSHAGAIHLSCGNSASLTRARYNQVNRYILQLKEAGWHIERRGVPTHQEYYFELVAPQIILPEAKKRP